MENAEIRIEIKPQDDFTEKGVDHIFIYAQTNLGEDFKPLKEIASGGELSRVFTGIFRKILSSQNSISVFLFDEIDTGIGGQTALNIGKKLTDVAGTSQVIAITHLPQIVAASNHIISVRKEVSVGSKAGRTFTKIQAVANKERHAT